MHREQFLQTIDHALRAAEAEGRDDHLAAQADRPRDNGMKLLHQSVVTIKFSIAVRAFGNKNIDPLHDRRDQGVSPCCGGRGRP